MAFSYITYAAAVSDQSSSPKTCSSALNVAAGDLLVCWLGYEDQANENASASDGGSNVFTMEAETSNAGGSKGRFGYILSATANAAATFVGVAGTAPYCGFYVFQFRPDAGETVSLDQKGTATGTGTSLATANITTTGTDEVVLMGCKNYNSASWSSPTIGGAAVTGSGTNGLTGVFYSLLTATATVGGAVTHANSNWVCNIISFKSASGGAATGNPHYAYRQMQEHLK